jgi:hypothetical protein
MADSSKDDLPQEQGLLQLLSQARQILEEIRSLKGQAEAHSREAEVSGKKAGSDALLAFNAKNACEEHATTIAGVKGTVEADANAISTNKQRSDEALAALNTAKAAFDGDAKAIEGRRKEADQTAATVEKAATALTRAAEAGAARLKEIEASKDSADVQARATAASAVAAAQGATDAGSALGKAQNSASEAAESAAAASANRDTTNQTVAETLALLADAKAAEDGLKEILQHLTKSDEIATGHERRVQALTAELQDLITRVDGLLPGATSAGLASSFNKQKSRFKDPQRQSLRAFVACIGLLFVLGVPSYLSVVFGWPHPTDAAWRSLILRLPIVLPIIWLAIYAGRNYMMSLRMEEDYAYKEAISTAFEGYKREMVNFAAGDSENPTPIMILCTNILRAIAERPGRIYEGRQKDINLLTEAQELIEKSAEFSKKKLATH